MDDYNMVFGERNPDYGGVGVLLTGLPGCGKTQVEGQIATEDLKRGNVVIWRAKDTCQWTMFLDKTDKLVFWLKKGLDYKLIDRTVGAEINLEDIIKVNEWTTPKNLVNRLSKNKINIVQTIPVNVDWHAQHGKFIQEWIQILQHLCKRYYSTPVSILFDEFEDFCPEGKFYRKSGQVSDMIKELRKNNINYFGATHRTTEIFWKVLNKIPWHIYMTGAIPIKKSKLYPDVLNKLKTGQAWMEGRRFQKVNFKMFAKPKEYHAMIKLPKKEIDKLKDTESKSDMRMNKGEYYLMIYKDVLQHNLTQTEAAKKYNLSQPRIAQIIKEVEKSFS